MMLRNRDTRHPLRPVITPVECCRQSGSVPVDDGVVNAAVHAAYFRRNALICAHAQALVLRVKQNTREFSKVFNSDIHIHIARRTHMAIYH